MTYVNPGWHNDKDGWLPPQTQDRLNILSNAVAGTSGTITSLTTLGAAGDGVTDDSAVLQTAITGGGRIYIPPLTFKVTTPITGLKAGTSLEFAPGAVIDASGLSGNNQLFSTSPSPTGDSGSVALSSDCAAGATTLSIAAGQEVNFPVGTYVKIGSQKQWSADTGLADNTMDGWRGEIGIVSSTASGSVTFQWPTFDAYAVADSAFIAPMTMIGNLSISGQGNIIGPGTGNNARGFKFDRTLHLRVRDITMTGWDDAAFVCKDAYDAVFDGISVIGGSSAANSFYGISWQFAAQFCTMANSTFKDVRHSATTDQIQGIRSGVPRFITYDACKAYRTKASSFDCHAYGEYVTIVNCHSYNATDSGISVRSPSAVIKNNTIVSPGQMGIYLRNQTLQASRYTVEGNQIFNAGLNGINWRTPAEAALAGTQAGTTVDGVTIANNIVKDSTNEGIICQSASGFNNLTQGTVQGNVIKFSSATRTGISLIRCTDVVVNNNTCTTGLVGISFDNNSDHCVAVGNNMRGSTTPISQGTGTGHVVTANST